MNSPTVSDSDKGGVKIFISHSTHDRQVAEKLNDLLLKALPLRESDITCTSTTGQGLTVGMPINEQLRKMIESADQFIVLVSRSGLSSLYVPFEAGARWATHPNIIRVLAPGEPANLLEDGPLQNMLKRRRMKRSSLFPIGATTQ